MSVQLPANTKLSRSDTLKGIYVELGKTLTETNISEERDLIPIQGIGNEYPDYIEGRWSLEPVTFDFSFGLNPNILSLLDKATEYSKSAYFRVELNDKSKSSTHGTYCIITGLVSEINQDYIDNSISLTVSPTAKSIIEKRD